MPTIVQSAGFCHNIIAIHGTTTPGTVSVTLPSNITIGNTLLIGIGTLPDPGTNTGLGNPATNSEAIADNLGNTYVNTLISHGGVQLQGVGIFICNTISTSGSCTVTFTCNFPNANPVFDLACRMAIIVVEISSIGSYSTHSIFQQNTVSGGTMNLVVTDHASISVTTGYGNPNQESGCVVDYILGGSSDFFVSVYAGARSAPYPTPPPIPSILPPGYLTWVNQQNVAILTGTPDWALEIYLGSPTITVCVYEQRGNIDYDQIGKDARHGGTVGSRIQYYTGGVSNPGNIPIFDGCENIIDSGTNFSSLGNVSTSGSLTNDEPIFGAGGDNIKVGTKSGNTDEVMTGTGSFTPGNLLITDPNHNVIDSGIPGNTVVDTLTTTGTSGPATLSGNTLNIPVYSGGGGSGPNFADNEIPAGVMDGTNQTYTLAHTPSPPQSVQLFLDGIFKYYAVDYTISGSTLVYTSDFPTDSSHGGVDIHRVYYRY